MNVQELQAKVDNAAAKKNAEERSLIENPAERSWGYKIKGRLRGLRRPP